ncbi:transposase [Neisseria mucosa]|nr:transposase [Neisseria mucosa]
MTPHHNTVYRDLLQDKSNGGTLWQYLEICSKPYRKRYGGTQT